MDMAQRIKKLRKQNNLTQEELASKLGLQKSAIAKYENGRVENMKRSIIQEMSRIFNVSPIYLLGWEEQEELSNKEEKLLMHFNNLNELGQKKALDNIYDLTLVPIYTKDKEVPEHLKVKAAHAKKGVSQEDIDHDLALMEDNEF